MKIDFKASIIMLLIPLLFLQCKKEGSGGKASIRGYIVGTNHSDGVQEITEITVTKGADIEHGDYWLLNNKIGNDFYYVWYNNPTWISNGNPNLSGRIGIKVDFNYSDSNIDIAIKTVEALQASLGEHYFISLNLDIIQLTSAYNAEIADADNGITGFNVDVTKQGKTENSESIGPVINHIVYLIYGDGETFYNETTTTGANGAYTFNELRKGDYKIYTLTKNVSDGTEVPIYKNVSIEKRKSIKDVEAISIVY